MNARATTLFTALFFVTVTGLADASLDRFLLWQMVAGSFRLSTVDGRMHLGNNGGQNQKVIEKNEKFDKAVFQIGDKGTALSTSKCAIVKSQDCVGYFGYDEAGRAKYTLTQIPENGQITRSVCAVGYDRKKNGEPGLNNCLTMTKKSCEEWEQYKNGSPVYKALANTDATNAKLKECNDLIGNMNRSREVLKNLFGTDENTLSEIQKNYEITRPDRATRGVFQSAAIVKSMDGVEKGILKLTGDIQTASDVCDDARASKIFLSKEELNAAQKQYYKNINTPVEKSVPQSSGAAGANKRQ